MQAIEQEFRIEIFARHIPSPSLPPFGDRVADGFKFEASRQRYVLVPAPLRCCFDADEPCLFECLQPPRQESRGYLWHALMNIVEAPAAVENAPNYQKVPAFA